MYCLCISNVSLMYWQCICKLCLTPLFSSQYVLEMYLIGLFQCIGHVFTIQYIPIHHRGTGMYYRMYWDVFTDVLGCIWWGILVHVQDGNTSQYSWQYITIHRGIHHNTSKIHPNTSVMYWDVNTSKKYLIHLKYIPIHPNTSSTSSAIC